MICNLQRINDDINDLTENQMLCTLKIFNIRVSGRQRNSRDAVIGTNNFTAYPQNKNSCAHAVRNQPVAAPLFSLNVHWLSSSNIQCPI